MVKWIVFFLFLFELIKQTDNCINQKTLTQIIVFNCTFVWYRRRLYFKAHEKHSVYVGVNCILHILGLKKRFTRNGLRLTVYSYTLSQSDKAIPSTTTTKTVLELLVISLLAWYEWPVCTFVYSKFDQIWVSIFRSNVVCLLTNLLTNHRQKSDSF